MSSSQINNSTAIRKQRALYSSPFSDPAVEDDVHFQKMHSSYHYLVTHGNKVKSVIDESASRI